MMTKALTDILGLQYYNELPPNTRLGLTKDFIRLIPGKRDKTKEENYEIIDGMYYLVYSEIQKRYDLYQLSVEQGRCESIRTLQEYFKPFIESKRLFTFNT